MTIAASIIFILLATYWFGFKEGFFSGLIHLACVIVAGAVAFAFWEPLAVAMLGSSSTREWAWGVSLLAIFCFALFLLRLAGNLLIPDKLNFPHLVDILGGGATGAAAGLLTAGIGLIGVGMLPIGNPSGYVRAQSGNSVAPTQKTSESRYFAATMTEQFYDMLSLGAFKPLTNRGNLATSYPALTKQAWSLQRDTVQRGRVELAVSPSDLTVGTPYQGAFPMPGITGDAVIVPITVQRGGFHKGSNFVLSSSQAHLIGGGSSPAIAFPEGWREGGVNYLFDGLTNYATNVPGEQSVSLMLAFDAADLRGQAPTSLMFKGLRIPLAQASNDLATLDMGSGGAGIDYDRNATPIPATYVKLDSRIGVILNRNSLPPGIEAEGNTITLADGDDVQSRTTGTISKSLRVDRLYELPGTKIVRLDVSRGKSPVDIWGENRAKGGIDNPLVLVDDEGKTYLPIGWLHKKASDNLLNIKFDARDGVPELEGLPLLSTAGRDELDVLYSIPVNRRIVAIKIGDVTVGVTNVTVAP